MFCKKCGNKSGDDSKFCGKCGTENESKKIETEYYDFLYIPISRLIWVSILSFGLYTIYWFSSNWTAIKKITGEKISPFWRGVFSIFYSYRPFSLALKQAKSLGYGNSYNVDFMASFYVIAIIVDRVVSKTVNESSDTSLTFILLWIIIGTMLIIYPLIRAQQAINWSNEKKGKIFKKIGLPEFGLIIISWVITILSAFADM